MSGDIVMLNHPIFSKKIFINFNKDLLKPKPILPLDDKPSPKNYRIPPRKYILKSRGDRFGYQAPQNPEDLTENNEYVYKSSRKEKSHAPQYIKTETNLDDNEVQPLRREQKRYRTLILSIKKPAKSDFFLQLPPQKPNDIKQAGFFSPRAHVASDRILNSPKSNAISEYQLGFCSPKHNKTPLYS